MMVKWFLLGIAALVAAEVAAIIAVAAVLGVLPALALMAATSLLGLAVLLEAGGDAFLTVAAGFLLFVPGFITDAAGLLLLLSPVRRWIGGRFQRSMKARPSGSPGVVELEPQEWNRVPERQIDDQRRPADPA